MKFKIQKPYFTMKILAFGLSLLPFAFALPGLEKEMKKIHPEMQITCLSCHDRPNGTNPNNQNVTLAGHAYYHEILEKRGAHSYDSIPSQAPEKTSQKPKESKSVKMPKGLRTDIVVFGDSRSNLKVHQEVVKKICQYQPAIVLHTGDIVADGMNAAQWKEIMPFYQCLLNRKVLHHACGNHEGKGCLNSPLREAIGRKEPYYTIDFRGITFIILNTEEFTWDQMQWLSHLPQNKVYIPIYHHPPYPTISGHAAEKNVVDHYVPRLKKLKIKVSFNGHNHGYDRALNDGIQWVTTGGGGAPLYPCGIAQKYTRSCHSAYHLVRCQLDGKKLSCQAELLDGNVIDSFVIDSL